MARIIKFLQLPPGIKIEMTGYDEDDTMSKVVDIVLSGLKEILTEGEYTIAEIKSALMVRYISLIEEVTGEQITPLEAPLLNQLAATTLNLILSQLEAAGAIRIENDKIIVNKKIAEIVLHGMPPQPWKDIADYASRIYTPGPETIVPNGVYIAVTDAPANDINPPAPIVKLSKVGENYFAVLVLTTLRYTEPIHA